MKNMSLSYLILISVLFFTACAKEQQKSTNEVIPAVANVQDKNLVLTPGGWRPASKVGRISSGEHLSVINGRLNRVDNASGKVTKDFGIVESKTGNEARRILPLGSGWITYTHWTNSSSTPITYMASTFTVPPAPATANGQTIFLFPGLENSTYILQPVLQWGPSAAGGGNYWAIANWYVGFDGSAGFSNLIRVNPGTVLKGVMTQTGTTGSNYNYSSAFSGYPSITLALNNTQKLFWAIETLEAYNVVACSNYPNTAKTRFSAIEIHVGSAQAPLAWNVVNEITDCGQHATVVTNGSPNGIVDLFY